MFTIIQTKAGYSIQNTKTYVIVFTYITRQQAEQALNKFNKLQSEYQKIYYKA